MSLLTSRIARVTTIATTSLLIALADPPAQATQNGPIAHPITLDNVALNVVTPDFPSGAMYVAQPGDAVQVASLSDDVPFRYLSVTTVPYGEKLPGSQFPASAPGDAAAWREALHGDPNGPIATVFGERTPGVVLHSQGNLGDGTGIATRIETVKWIVEKGKRTWVITLQHDEASLPASFGSGLSVTGYDPDVPTTVGTVAPAPQVGAAAVPVGGSLGRPSWWSATCDGYGSLLNTKFMGLQVCGGVSVDRLENDIPGVAQYEWECAELSDRYLVQRYGFNGAGGNGNRVAQNAYNAHPSLFQLHTNGAHTPPVAGDVVSFAVGAPSAGHPGVVTGSSVNSAGNGTINIVEQNWSASGVRTGIPVSNWNVSEITGQGGTVAWLHNPSDGTTSSMAPGMSPIVGTGDINGTGVGDFVARGTDGHLYSYMGVGDNTFTGRTDLGGGWSQYDMIIGAGDINKTGVPDLLARDRNGHLWSYMGVGDGTFTGRTDLGGGWSQYDMIIGAGDMHRTGAADIIARDPSGDLWIYKAVGDGTFAGRTKIGYGFDIYDTMIGVGDINKTGVPDVLARDRNGHLWSYMGIGDGTLSGRTDRGGGWGQYDALAGPGDINRTGVPDLIARDMSGNLYAYMGIGDGSFTGRVSVGYGYDIYS